MRQEREVVAFRAEVRRALAAPLGGSLASQFHVPAVTALIADGRDADHEVVALAELMDALVRVGVPRGRQFVLVAHAAVGRELARERTARLRAVLGAPVIAHDPARPASFAAGTLADGTAIELDDELREAEAIVLVGRLASAGAEGVRGGPATLWPGLSSAEARERFATSLPGGAEARLTAATARLREMLSVVPGTFALWWDAGDPPRVRAGETSALLAACLREGWLTRPARTDA